MRITVIDKIDTNIPADLFLGSDANGICFAIRQVCIIGEDGKVERTCRMTKELIDKLKTVKIAF